MKMLKPHHLQTNQYALPLLGITSGRAKAALTASPLVMRLRKYTKLNKRIRAPTGTAPSAPLRGAILYDIVAQTRSQEFKVMKFENLRGKYVVDFLVAKYLVNFSLENRLRNCHRNFTTFFTQKFTRSKEICHLAITLGAISRKISWISSNSSTARSSTHALQARRKPRMRRSRSLVYRPSVPADGRMRKSLQMGTCTKQPRWCQVCSL